MGEEKKSVRWAEIAGLCKAEASRATDSTTAERWGEAEKRAEAAVVVAVRVEKLQRMLTEATVALQAAEKLATAAWRATRQTET